MVILICFGFGVLLGLQLALFRYLDKQQEEKFKELSVEIDRLSSENIRILRDINLEFVDKEKFNLLTDYLKLKYEYEPGSFKIVKKGN